MKKQWKWLISALALVVILPLAVLLYRNLSDRYLRDQATAAETTELVTDAAETTGVPESVAFEETAAPQSAPENADASAATATAAPTAAAAAPTTTAAPPTKTAAPPTTTAAPPTTTAAPPTTTQKPEPPKELAADFVVYDGNGSAVRLSDHFGKPLVVNFWASWCGPCCRELPAFDAAAKQYAGKIDFMMVNLESPGEVREFLAENGYTFPVYYDTDESASNAYNIYSIPLTVFIRADGTVMDSHIGSMEESTLQSYLAKLSA